MSGMRTERPGARYAVHLCPQPRWVKLRPEGCLGGCEEDTLKHLRAAGLVVVQVHSRLEAQHLCEEGGHPPAHILELIPHLKGTASPELWLILLCVIL